MLCSLLDRNAEDCAVVLHEALTAIQTADTTDGGEGGGAARLLYGTSLYAVNSLCNSLLLIFK